MLHIRLVAAMLSWLFQCLDAQGLSVVVGGPLADDCNGQLTVAAASLCDVLVLPSLSIMPMLERGLPCWSWLVHHRRSCYTMVFQQ